MHIAFVLPDRGSVSSYPRKSIRYRSPAGMTVAKPAGMVSGGDILNRYLIEGWQQAGIAVDVFTPAQIPSTDFSLVIIDGILFAEMEPHLAILRRSSRVVGLCHVPLTILGETNSYEQERAFYAGLDGIIFPSAATATRTFAHFGLIATPIFILGPARSSVPCLEKPLARSKPLRLLQIGRWDRNKDQLGLLHALKKVSSKVEWELVLVGDAEYDLAYSTEVDAARSYFEPGKVRVYPAMSHSDLFALYRQADILIVASRYESLSLATIDAFMHGLAVLSWSKGGIRSLLKCGGGKLLNHPDDLKTTLKQLWYLPSALTCLQQKSLSFAKRLPTWRMRALALSERFSVNNYLK